MTRKDKIKNTAISIVVLSLFALLIYCISVVETRYHTRTNPREYQIDLDENGYIHLYDGERFVGKVHTDSISINELVLKDNE